MTFEKAQDKLTRAYAKAGGQNAGALPWAAIIQAILSILSGCSTPAAKSFGKAHPLALEFLLRRKLDETEMAASTKDRKLVAKAGVTAFNSASAADIDDLRD